MWSQKAVSDIVNFKVFLGEGMGTTCPRSPLLSLSLRTLEIVDPVPFLHVQMPVLQKNKLHVAHSFEGAVR